MRTATFTRLPGGAWGILVPGRANVGDSVEVRRRDGQVKFVSVLERLVTVRRGQAVFTLCTFRSWPTLHIPGLTWTRTQEAARVELVAFLTRREAW